MRPFLFSAFAGRRWHLPAGMMFALLFSLSAPGQSPSFSSGTERTDLIELYTSEGCSSCPPAEAWLGERRNDPGLWREFVPVAFHVNYWDRLGWRDRFAQPSFTDRQRAYAAVWKSQTVYTPGFVRAGREWRPGAATPGEDGPAGRLAATIDDGKIAVTYQPARPGRYRVWVALLGNGLQSEVRRGENAGRTLHHEFLALGLVDTALTATGAGGDQSVTLDLSLTAERPARRAVAVWVTPADGLTPLQATGGWLP